jgi:predicted AAA+ superfamily ATPase
MDKKNRIKDIIINQHNKPAEINLLPRELKLPLNSGKIVVVSGIRRCGKTTVLKLTRNALLNSNIGKHKILFFNFDDERLILKTNELDVILQAYREIYPELDLGESYFFFDEIQNIENWEKFVRRVYDNETKNIFISGSNSKLLGSEIATSLRGRTMLYELYPLSFTEYLSFCNINTQYYGDKNYAAIQNAFNKYLKEGGFPETIGKNIEEREYILGDYFQVLLFRDIIERYKLTRIAALKYYIQKLVANLGKPFSINKIYNELKSQGTKVDKEYLYEILDYVEAVYLGFRLYKFDYAVVNREMSDKKMYLADNGLLNGISWQFSEDKGKLLENIVFVWLKQKAKNNLFYYSQTSECDFVVFDRDKATQCIQVSYDISEPETRKREITGLLKAMNYFKLQKGYIITAEQEENLIVDNKMIFIKPAYMVFIDNNI